MQTGNLSFLSRDTRAGLLFKAATVAAACAFGITLTNVYGPRNTAALALCQFAVLLLVLSPVVLIILKQQDRLEALCRAAEDLEAGVPHVPGALQGEDRLGRLGKSLQSISHRQAELSDLAVQMSQGNLLRDVLPRSERDEFGNALGTLIRKLRLMVGALETNCREVSDSAKSVSDVVGVAVHSVNSLSEWITALAMTANTASGHSGSLASAVEDQSESVRAAADAMANLEQLVRSVSESAREQASLAVSVGDEMVTASDMAEQGGTAARSLADQAARAARTAEEGSASVTDALRLLQQVRDSVCEGSKRVGDLVRVGGCIREVVLSIEQIARQTNLLSLNAAIEAARAGEHGHGFSVVAEEIRSLADRTAVLTREIADLLKSVSEAGEQAVAAMDGGSADVEAVAMAGERAGKSLEAILTTVHSTADYARTVSETVVSMSTAVKSARESVDRMLDLAQENGEAATHMASAVEHSAEMLHKVRSAASQIDSQASASCDITSEVAQSAETLSGALRQQAERLNEADNLTKTLDKSTEESERLLERFQFEWDRRKGETSPPVDRNGRSYARTQTIRQAALRAWMEDVAASPDPPSDEKPLAA